jgi:L-aminopeptidase/D-esterase-like protein
MGVPTLAGPVPIVVGAVLFDLTVGNPRVRPDSAAGYAACVAATATTTSLGAVGAGAGATIDKWQGPDGVLPGGLVSAAHHQDDLVVAALVAVNAFGGVHDGRRRAWVDIEPPVAGLAHTTIGVVATNATLDKVGCLLVAQSAHDGLARALEPVHATVDGDAFVAAAVGGVTAKVDQVRLLAARAVEDAVRAVVAPAG